MSILIKGIDMPKDCESICVTIWNDGIIYATDENKNQIDTKKSKAIQIPTPHGRLIDESKMRFYYEERWTYTPNGIEKDRTRIYRDEDVLDTPTILEAEE